MAENDCSAQVTSCERVVQEAQKTIAAGEKVINLKTREISAQNDLINLQDTQIKNLSKDKNSIFSNPWLFFTLGIITGALIIKK